MNETKNKSQKGKKPNNKKQSTSSAKKAVQNVVSGGKTSTTKQSNPKSNKGKAVKNTQPQNKNISKKKPATTYKKRNNASITPAKPVKIIPLGGLGEVGKNITLYEYDGDMLIVDCGMTFPDEDTPGVDSVIPDFTYVLENKDKIKGLVVTHGHEDHIGAIPYLLKQLNVPIYATRLTIGLIAGKLKEHKLLGDAKLNEIADGKTINLGKFSVEFIHVNHSIPDAVAFAISCGAGTVVHMGDFKIDTTPIDDKVIDLARFAELGKSGVLAMLSDSTNAERPGYTSSERIVGESLSNLFKKAEGHRIVVATFSSNIHRIQQIIDEAARCKRKVAVSGRSMINVVNVAAELGYLKLPSGILVEIETIKNYSPSELVVITTGSQGEPMSALTRMATNEHRQVEIAPGDMIIISATPIPGNEKLVSRVVNELMKRGANVVYEKMYDVHVSGHACQEEQKLMMSVVNPRYFIPIHGEQKHLYKHAQLAYAMGIDYKNVIIGANGNVFELSSAGIKCTETVTAGRVLVDGLGVGDVGSIVLRDRKHLSEDGIIVVTVAIDSFTREVVSGPDIVSRGFVYVKESDELMEALENVVCTALENCYVLGVKDWNTIKTRIKDSVAKFLYNKTHRSPMVLPVIMEV
ncbi:MAG: RNase J family beta-CASP ribonuclease [Ruminococcaceae bacterium]|nr:RNase J family beta-CASP ribonuclease [Oscillospiraceae bacterium]